MAEIKDLPGWPSKVLVAKVKKTVWSYVRSRPQIHDRYWQMAWEWADNIARAASRWEFSKRPRKRWPHPHEIASQYLWLCLLEMKSSSNLRLPFNAGKHIPASAMRELSLLSQQKLAVLRVEAEREMMSIEDDAIAGYWSFKTCNRDLNDKKATAVSQPAHH